MPLGYWAVGLLAFLVIFGASFCIAVFPIARLIIGIIFVILIAIGFAALIGMTIMTIIESYPFGWR